MFWVLGKDKVITHLLMHCDVAKQTLTLFPMAQTKCKLKPYYLNKQSYLSSFLLTCGKGPEWQWSTPGHGLLSVCRPVWTCIITWGK